MRLLRFFKGMYFSIAYYSYGGVSVKEMARKFYNKFISRKKLIAVLSELHEHKFLQKKPIEVNDFNELFPFRFMNIKEREITECMCLAINARVFEEDYQPLVEKIRDSVEASAESLTVIWLLEAEILAIFGGLFILAEELRQLCASKTIKRYERKRKVQCFDARRLYVCYLNVGQLDKAEEVFARAGKAWRQRNNKIKQYISCIANGRMFSEISIKKETEADRIYHEMLKGKSVAIIGPAVGSFDIDEIECELDLKVRINYRSKEFLPEEEQKSKVDISYFSGENGDVISKMPNRLHLNELKMIVFKTVKNDTQKDLLQKGKARVKAGYASSLLFQGHAFMAQVIIMDLLHFSPGRIKIIKTNLFLATAIERYHNGYQINDRKASLERKPFWSIWWNFASHNIISNYELMKLMYDNGYFEADEELTEILSLGTKEYMRQMELLSNQM